MKELKNWIAEYNIDCTFDGTVLVINNFGVALFVAPKDNKIISNDWSLNLSDEDYDILDASEEIKFIIFQFGNRFYYCDSNNRKKNEYNEDVIIPKFNDFRNIGKFNSEFEDLQFCHLGIHTGYELLNGSGEAELWIKKAKFLNYKSLGICERNTLAGTLAFQLQCQKYDIKSILGQTISVAYNYSEDKEFQNIYDIKLFVKNKIGWQNLLRISKAINVDYNDFIPLEELLELSEGLMFVFFKESYIHNNIYKKENVIKDLKTFKKYVSKDDLYYQIDLTEFSDGEYDLDNLNKIKFYFENYSLKIKPIYIEDSYYVDKIDSGVKSILNKIDRKTQPSSSEQYLKSVDEIVEKYIPLFSNDNSFDLFFQSISNTNEISEKSNFSIDIGNHKLPKYKVKNKEQFYLDLITKGFEEKILPKYGDDMDKLNLYLERIEEENSVIMSAGLIDYFLILWDVIDWAKKQDILVGPGRGSAGGSMVCYMLGIIEIDPIEYDLLFERFLNKTRVSGERAKSADSLPDIDTDFEGKRRQDVKRYMEQKFNVHNVCSIGTYARLKTKSAIKDFGRAKGLDFKKVNYATKEIPDAIDYDWADMFINSLKSNELKNFVQENIDMCETIKAPLGQPRSRSIHPSAVIIVPKEDEDGNPMEVYDWLPIKKMDGELVSEWEGKYIDRAGFLKEDILGIAQLDKFKYILDLIKLNYNEKIDLNKIPVNDDNVFEYFSKGWNEDVFQFGTAGLKTYSQRVKPNNIEDLISMNALFRPGPMDSNAHNDFVEIRRGKKKSQIDYGMEDVVKFTNGLYIYQEQVMRAMVVAGLTLVEADEIRTHMKKFNKVELAKFREKFILGYSEIILSYEPKMKTDKLLSEADKVWDKLNAFSRYGFNKSHAAAYSLIGYWSQWLKVNYPLEFWTASLNFAKESEEIPSRISEIKKIKNGIKVVEPDINKSDLNFMSDVEENKIYWSLTKIKFVGEVAVKEILKERENGEFFSLEDFVKRVPKAKVNKRTISCLIEAGAFDRISSEKIDMQNQGQARHRYLILKEFLGTRNEPIPEEIERNKAKNKNWFWRLKQKELTGFGDINYKILVKKKWPQPKLVDKQYLDGDILNELLFDEVKYVKAITAGRIMSLKEKSSKRGDYAVIYLEHNNSIVMVHLWNDVWGDKKIQSKLKELELNKNMFAISGEVKPDMWKNKNVLFGIDTTKIVEL
jgi:DNA polymerase III subunit alpha